MFDPDQYQLIDFGRGRKLERFNSLVVDRPAPAAVSAVPQRPELWESATARFLESASGAAPQRGDWKWRPEAGAPQGEYTVRHGRFQLALGFTPFGHVGLFPEQSANWDWIADQVAAAARPVRMLNMFAYTGGSTLAAAAAGAEVTHVDAARSVVTWARRNAEHSRLAHAPIRWIVDDVLKYAARELRRGRRYEAIVLDPPSYGHGPKGESWQIDQHLPELLAICGQLLSESGSFLLLTCHTPAWSQERLERAVRAAVGGKTTSPRSFRLTSGELNLTSHDGNFLNCGCFARGEAAH